MSSSAPNGKSLDDALGMEMGGMSMGSGGDRAHGAPLDRRDQLRKVLAEAGLKPEAEDLLLSAADGYTVTIQPEVATGFDGAARGRSERRATDRRARLSLPPSGPATLRDDELQVARAD